ncbi:hypothetical protein [Amaricoccus sp.]|uniref:hypothetical protein n=1 Tax=Amaricoccus sp. TaxID=1872485 RepID=UPI001B68C340|nr:hypothetical protein [Amaricoccus sp.]MBP7000379.1 hypothetical protein [Amaricoccus sp.]
MNAMTGDEYRRSGRGGAGRLEPVMVDLPPDPFEDLAAPPMRLGPPPPRPAPARPVEPVAPPAPPAVSLASHEDLADHPFELTDAGPEAPHEGGAAEARPSFEATFAGVSDPVPQPALAVRQRAAVAPPPAPASRGLRQLRAAVLVGLLTAAAIVALAVMFRPEPAAEVAADAAAVPTELGSGPVPAPAAAGPAATAVAAAKVRLRVDPDMPEARRAALGAAIDTAGYGALEVSPTTAPIDRGRVEYFHPADEAAAEALARSLAPLTGGPLDVHDLSAITLGAEPGRIDVWVAQ